MVEPSKLIRPRGAIKGRDDTSIATIILYEKGTYTKPKNPPAFLENLDTRVAQPVTNKPNSYSKDVAILDLDGRNPYYAIFNNFILSSVSESSSTINKVHMNFSDSWNAFFFNENPVMIQFQGGFIDTEEFPYYQEFMVAYEKYMSGTKLTDNNMRMLISYDGKVVDGFITSLATTSDSMSQGYKAFQMSIMAKETTWSRVNDMFMSDGYKVSHLSSPDLMYNAMSNLGRLQTEYGTDPEVAERMKKEESDRIEAEKRNIARGKSYSDSHKNASRRRLEAEARAANDTVIRGKEGEKMQGTGISYA